MKTKTLLIAAAALAVGVISSQAQVYSQNIVGYANIKLNTGYNIVVNQFNCGVSNGANEIFPSVADGTTFLQWNGTGYTYSIKDSSAPPAIWYMSDYSTPTNPPIISPGTAVFVQVGAVVTNTMVGTVVPNSGSTYTNSLVAGYNLIGSAIPVGGSLTNSLFAFTPPDGTTMLQYNGAGYTYNIFDQSAPPVQWYMSDYSTPTNAPNINVGQGFFLQLGTAYKYIQAMP